jgi:hypothetical protein
VEEITEGDEAETLLGEVRSFVIYPLLLGVPETEQYDFHVLNWEARFQSEAVYLKSCPE